MKKIIFTMLILIALVATIYNAIKPDYIRANEYLQNACMVDMASDKDIICD